MSSGITFQQYGKQDVRVFRVHREGDKHFVRELRVSLLLDGKQLDSSYTNADNSLVVPTDTCKNTIYWGAKEWGIESPEIFATRLVEHMLREYSHIDRAISGVEETFWDRMPVKGRPHEHSFVRRGPATRFGGAEAHRSGPRKGTTVTSGVQGLQVMKTTGSGFVGFHRCPRTTLPEISDRTVKTTLWARWQWRLNYRGSRSQYDEVYERVQQVFFDRLGASYSRSVQETGYLSACDILRSDAKVQNFHFVLPNEHLWHYDVERFGQKNNNEVYWTVDDPSGRIECRVDRDQAKL